MARLCMIPSDTPANHIQSDSLANQGNVHLRIQSDSPVNLWNAHHHNELDSLANLGISLKVHLHIHVHSVVAVAHGTRS